MFRFESSPPATVAVLLRDSVHGIGRFEKDGRKDSEGLQIFKQRLLLVRTEVRAEVVTAIAVAGVELVAAGNGAIRTRRILRCGETDIIDVVFRAEAECHLALC